MSRLSLVSKASHLCQNVLPLSGRSTHQQSRFSHDHSPYGDFPSATFLQILFNTICRIVRTRLPANGALNFLYPTSHYLIF